MEFFPSASFFSNLSSTIWSMSLLFYCQGSGARIIVLSCSVSGLGQPQDMQVAGTTLLFHPKPPPPPPPQIAPPFPCLRRWGGGRGLLSTLVQVWQELTVKPPVVSLIPSKLPLNWNKKASS